MKKRNISVLGILLVCLFLPIQQIESENNFKEYQLKPGQALFLSGSSQWHHRHDIANQGDAQAYCDMLHLHYVPKGCSDFLEPKNW